MNLQDANDPEWPAVLAILARWGETIQRHEHLECRPDALDEIDAPILSFMDRSMNYQWERDPAFDVYAAGLGLWIQNMAGALRETIGRGRGAVCWSRFYPRIGKRTQDNGGSAVIVVRLAADLLAMAGDEDDPELLLQDVFIAALWGARVPYPEGYFLKHTTREMVLVMLCDYFNGTEPGQ